MANIVPDRGGSDRAIQPKLYGKGWSDTMHSSASKKMEYFHKDTRMGQNPTNYNVNVWRQHPEGVSDSSSLHVGQFARVTPGKNKQGQSGVYLHHLDQGGSPTFMPDSSVHAITWSERKKGK